MALIKRNFLGGKMDQDSDERLLPDGTFRHVENGMIINSEGSDAGALQNSLPNKRLTNISQGSNVETLSMLCDPSGNKIYWHTLTSTGCYLYEYDNKNDVVSVLLADTRPVGAGRVLDLNKNFLITAFEKVLSENPDEELLIWSDDNMEPCCINISRSKTWALNGFELEDILLIKKPPRYAPILTPIFQLQKTNNIEERYLSFSYRYKYLDGEYSALSDYTNYFFFPKEFKLDFVTLDNLGMVNAFNGVRIGFNTGDYRVVEIQLVVKEANSNNLYLIESFNKIEQGWSSNQIKTYTFSNDKIYTILPIKELGRSFDNVPLKAKSLALIGNRIVFGNYVEGRDLIDVNGNPIAVDYELSLINDEIEQIEDFDSVYLDNTMTVVNTNSYPLLKGYKISIYFDISVNGQTSYQKDFYYILENDYATLADLFNSDEFAAFFVIINTDFVNTYTFDMPSGTAYVETIAPSITYSIVSGSPKFTVTPVTFEDTLDGDSVHVYDFTIVPTSNVSISKTSNSSSLKTNQDYQVGIIYQDKFNRRTTVLTSLYNSIFIPQTFSVFKNRIKVTLNNKPPSWADRYKIVVKAKPLQYQTIYINKFYNEDLFVWCKLEAENKDKVKVGDILIVKKAADKVIINPIKVKVLAVESKLKDFISGNVDDNTNPIIEEAGYYMKIRPEDFSMDFDDYRIYQDYNKGKSSGQPYAYVSLFTTITPGLLPGDPDVITELTIPSGSSISIFIDSSFKFSSGWRDVIYDNIFYAQRDYVSMDEFLNEVFLNRPIYANKGNAVGDYETYVSLTRGYFSTGPFGIKIFNPTLTGKQYLKVRGYYTGGSGGRSGRVEAKIVVRTSTGTYVFETEPKQAENDIYYETEQCFDVVANNHQGNLQNQDTASFTPAIIDLDFFNCFTQGNGVESYKIRDGFNTNALNIDLRPSAESLEAYRQVRKQADLTFGETYVESSNINGLNEFNLSTGNWKELDKQYGSIQKMDSRDNDVLVLQERKASKVLYQKDVLYNPDGTSNIAKSDKILGSQQMYLGDNGIGKHPEGYAKNSYQIFYPNQNKGVIQRLSIDGVTDIVDGMVGFFRDLFGQNAKSKKIGGFDPYRNEYFLFSDSTVSEVYELNCGNSIFKSNEVSPFTYVLNLNDLQGEITINYNITHGKATIVATYDGVNYIRPNVYGHGSIIIPRNNLNLDTVSVVITPSIGSYDFDDEIVQDITYVDYEIANLCPIGYPLKVISIVANDATDNTESITNRFRWGVSPFYSNVDVFDDDVLSKFEVENGIEGIGKFPNRGSIVNIQSYKDLYNNGSFKEIECNRIGYLITSTLYTSADLDTIMSLATFISLTHTTIGVDTELFSGNFLFNRSLNNEILYLIWDYTNRRIDVSDDSIGIIVGGGVLIPVGVPFTITSGPEHGSIVLDTDLHTITYTHDSTINGLDSITYQVGEADCISEATVTINISAPLNNINVHYGYELFADSSQYDFSGDTQQFLKCDVYADLIVPTLASLLILPGGSHFIGIIEVGKQMYSLASGIYTPSTASGNYIMIADSVNAEELTAGVYILVLVDGVVDDIVNFTDLPTCP